MKFKGPVNETKLMMYLVSMKMLKLPPTEQVGCLLNVALSRQQLGLNFAFENVATCLQTFLFGLASLFSFSVGTSKA